MNLIGQTVRHEIFGKGTVTDCAQQILTIRFAEGNHSFLYPEAFSKYLVALNPELQEQILSTIREEEQTRQAREQAELDQWEKEIALRSRKIPTRSQAAFDIHPQDIEQVFTDWTVSTGTYLSGYSKGEPRIPDRMGPHSLCVLTGRDAGAPEAERRILGLFMAPEDFDGTSCEDGRICAHPVHRLRLHADEQVPFWPYLTDREDKMKWGSTAFKYLPNDVGAKLLREICRKQNSPAASEFYSYFCLLNHLD